MGKEEGEGGMEGEREGEGGDRGQERWWAGWKPFSKIGTLQNKKRDPCFKMKQGSPFSTSASSPPTISLSTLPCSLSLFFLLSPPPSLDLMNRSAQLCQSTLITVWNASKLFAAAQQTFGVTKFCKKSWK